jgi:riboflavin kinase/FMN adenylyltransferase
MLLFIHRNSSKGFFNDESREVFVLFDFSEDLYGQTIETELVAFLRPEEKFDGLDAMIAQIHEDERAARALLLPEL